MLPPRNFGLLKASLGQVSKALRQFAKQKLWKLEKLSSLHFTSLHSTPDSPTHQRFQRVWCLV